MPTKTPLRDGEKRAADEDREIGDRKMENEDLPPRRLTEAGH
jgi:hypothetical protein